VHNDLMAHSPLYMFGCILVIAVMGIGLWAYFVKE